MFIVTEYAALIVNSVDPDEMLHCAEFHLGHHCLPSTHLGATSI